MVKKIKKYSSSDSVIREADKHYDSVLDQEQRENGKLQGFSIYEQKFDKQD